MAVDILGNPAAPDDDGTRRVHYESPVALTPPDATYPIPLELTESKAAYPRIWVWKVHKPPN
jgi:hypothetical protein